MTKNVYISNLSRTMESEPIIFNIKQEDKLNNIKDKQNIASFPIPCKICLGKLMINDNRWVPQILSQAYKLLIDCLNPITNYFQRETLKKNVTWFNYTIHNSCILLEKGGSKSSTSHSDNKIHKTEGLLQLRCFTKNADTIKLR